MQEPPFKKSDHLVRRAMVTYHVAPTSCLGRLLAFAVTSIILVAAFFLSIFFFWAILTVVLFLIVYASLISRRKRMQEAKIIDGEFEVKEDETSRSDRTSRH